MRYKNYKITGNTRGDCYNGLNCLGGVIRRPLIMYYNIYPYGTHLKEQIVLSKLLKVMFEE